MIQQWMNWRTLLGLIAISIVIGTVFYSRYLAKKIEFQERQKIEQWADAVRDNSDPDSKVSNLAVRVLAENSLDIPIILVNEKDSILDLRNIDSAKIKEDKNYLIKKITSFKSLHESIDWKNPFDSTQINRVYYGNSRLLNEVTYYPIIQLFIVTLFIIIIIVAQVANSRSTQNQVWVGLAKETAHQLGTPVTSLQGWLEMMKEIEGNEKITVEIEKDIQRLLLITDRFGKIGSIPQLEAHDIVVQIQSMIDYVKKRIGGKVAIAFEYDSSQDFIATISAPLFDWVIENLLKNALDAIEGKGNIWVNLYQEKNQMIIDITDNGKGISKANIHKVFNPGFTTKKRGWGLGLTLTKRIINQYHQGNIFVKQSEIGKGTTFRIVLNTQKV